MVKLETIEMIIDGGKAAPNAAIAQKLGPMKIPIPKVMEEINKKTSEFKGMKIPVKLHVNPETKEFTIDVGSPSVTELIKKEINLEKGSGTPNKVKAANIPIEQVIKIAKMKHDALLSRDLKTSVKQIVGSCGSLGILIESKESHDINEAISKGTYDSLINNPQEATKEKIQELQAALTKINEDLKKQFEKAVEVPAEGTVPVEGAVPAEGAAAPAAGAKPGEAAKAGVAKPGAAPAAGATPAKGAPAAKGAAPAAPAKGTEKKAPAKK
ncbi:MAG: 50S ribosomal protein L11 [Nanoarchaeota archaeon]|nr:50S ribosomal protein L11 [Nanoarchaeota archaeon]